MRLQRTVVVAVVGLACGGHSASNPAVGAEAPSYICQWIPHAPATARVIVDLRLESGNGNRLPDARDIRAIENAGGRVLHRFNLALVRADLDTGAVRDLIEGPARIATYARGVPDTAGLDVDAQVFYTRPVTDADERALREHGAQRVGRAPRPVLYAVIPDSLVPRVATLPGVDFVRAVAIGCEADL